MSPQTPPQIVSSETKLPAPPRTEHMNYESKITYQVQGNNTKSEEEYNVEMQL